MPWLDKELWHDSRKSDFARGNVDFERQLKDITGEQIDPTQFEVGRENTAFLEQLRQMREGTFTGESVDLPPETSSDKGG